MFYVKFFNSSCRRAVAVATFYDLGSAIDEARSVPLFSDGLAEWAEVVNSDGLRVWPRQKVAATIAR